MSGPSDQEVTSVLTDLSTDVFGVYSNVKILERGTRLANGSFPVKVKYDLTRSDKVSPQEFIWWFYKAQDQMGKAIWKGTNNTSELASELSKYK
jgi:hypothetical protein